MKVIVATHEGKKEGDVCFVPSGEIVIYPPFEDEHEDIAGTTMCGIEAHKDASIIKVVDREDIKNMDDLIGLILNGMSNAFAGYTREEAMEDAFDVCEIANNFPYQTILERIKSVRGNEFVPRYIK